MVLASVAIAAGRAATVPAWGSSWAVGLAGGGGQTQAGSAPGAPGSVGSSCPPLLSGQVTVTWSPVAGASTYSVYDSTSSSTSGYALIAGGVTGTSWTSTNLPSGTYWFEVAAVTGSYWQGPNSAASPSRTVVLDVSCL